MPLSTIVASSTGLVLAMKKVSFIIRKSLKSRGAMSSGIVNFLLVVLVIVPKHTVIIGYFVEEVNYLLLYAYTLL